METQLSPSLQRRILTLVQTNGTIERSALGLQTRPYDPENWEANLDDLVERGLITEASTIRVGEKSYRKQKRAVIIYSLAGNKLRDNDNEGVYYEIPKFEDMSAQEVHEFVQKFARRVVPAVASA